jgi:hypothetical protein
MDDKTTDLLLRVGAGALTGLGIIAVLVGYLGVRDEPDVALQIPYLFSGGLGGLALVGLGALCLIQLQMRQQAKQMALVTDELDEWKTTALAELRSFLASAVVEVELDVEDEDTVEVIRRQRTSTGSTTNGTARRRLKATPG